MPSAESHYAERCYAECNYAECRGAISFTDSTLGAVSMKTFLTKG